MLFIIRNLIIWKLKSKILIIFSKIAIPRECQCMTLRQYRVHALLSQQKRELALFSSLSPTINFSVRFLHSFRSNDFLALFFAHVLGGEPPGTRSIVAYSWARRLALDYRPTKQCDGNGTRGMALNTYELPGTKWLETIPGQLFLYSAHLDHRIAGYPSIRVIGVKRGALLPSALFCTIW